jgi:hypothetical protein
MVISAETGLQAVVCSDVSGARAGLWLPSPGGRATDPGPPVNRSSVPTRTAPMTTRWLWRLKSESPVWTMHVVSVDADAKHLLPARDDRRASSPSPAREQPLGGSGDDRWRPHRDGEVGNDAEMVGRPDAVDRLVEDARAGADVEG